MTVIRSQLIGTGYKLPAKILTNDDLSKMVETNDEWISTRTGIRSRHIAAEGETTCDLSYDAALTAIENAGIKNSEIDFVIVATVTPDNTFPATAAKLAKRLELNPGTPAMDVNAACSGFVYASQIADNMIRLGQVKTALVIGAETLSKITDWTDRNTCVLFGDGAGAAIFRAAEGTGDSSDTGDSCHQNLCRRQPVRPSLFGRRRFAEPKSRFYPHGRQRSFQSSHSEFGTGRGRKPEDCRHKHKRSQLVRSPSGQPADYRFRCQKA